MTSLGGHLGARTVVSGIRQEGESVRRLAFVFAVASLTGALLSPGPALAQTPLRSSVALFVPQTTAESPRAPLVISGTAGGDMITIQQNVDGSLTVTLNGHLQSVAALDVPRLVVDGGAGNDAITADATVTEGLTVFGGAGDDVIDDGGSGAAYVDGGPGGDTIHSGTGPGLLFGGEGNDQLTVRGVAGLMAGGPGADAYGGGSSSTQLFAQRGEQITSPGRVKWVPLGSTDAAGHAPGYVVHPVGTARFRIQVSAVVTALLSVPNGRKLLTALDDAGHTVTLSQARAGNQTAILDPAKAFLRGDGTHGTGSASAVSYGPYETVLDGGALDWQRRPPIVGLVHELVHALNAATGTMQRGKSTSGVLRLELQAIGLPFKGIAFRWTAAAAASPDNPKVFTENGFRALLGLAPRTAY
jgi:Ca2+-binding RTX toxin-like protein